MRPLKLELEGFKSYLNQTTIDFTKLDDGALFLISGKTGAGKTTIFDAIVYALYGQLSNGNKTKDAMMSKQLPEGKECSVSLDFEVRGRSYHVMRSFKNNKSQTMKHELVLPDVLQPLTKVSDINAKITEIIGLDANQFCQIVLLPQGDFQKFLVANTSERLPILQKIFKTERYQQITEKLDERRKAMNSDQKAMTERLAGYASDILSLVPTGDVRDQLLDSQTREQRQDFIDITTDYQRTVHEEVSAQQKKYQEQNTHLDRLKEITHQLAARDQAQAVQQTLDKERPAIDMLRQKVKRYQQSETLYHTILAKEANAEAQDKQQTALEALHEEKVTLDDKRKAFETKRAEWQPQIEQLPQKRQQQQQLQEEARDWQQIKTLEDTQTANQKQKETLETKIQSAQQAYDTAVTEHQEAASAHDVFISKQLTEKAVLDAESNYRKQSERLEASQQAYDKYQKIVDQQHQHQAKLATVEASLAEIEQTRAEIAISICQEMLVASEPCPVCGSTTHSLSSPSNDIDNMAFETTQKQYEAKLAEKSKRETELQHHAKQLKDLLAQANVESLEAWEEVLANDEATVTEAKQQWDARHQQFTEEQQQLAEMTEKLEALNQQIQQLDKNLTGDRATLASLIDIQQKTAEQLEALYQKVTFDDQAACQTELQNIEATITTLEEQKETLATEEKAQHDAELNHNYAMDKTTSEIERLKAEQTTQAADIERSLAEHTDWTLAAVKQWHEAWTSKVDVDRREQEVADFDNRDKRNRGALDNIEQALDKLEVSREATLSAYQNDQEALTSELNQLNNQILEDYSRYQRIAKLLSKLKHDYQAYETNRTDYETVNQLWQVLAGKGAGLNMALETYVLRRYLVKVIVRSNQRLATMTQGRYSFKLKELQAKGNSFVGLDMSMIDSYNGERDISTLSGGETFQASIALALGLSEVIQEQAGAIDMGILFIDEGFGTLDEAEALPTAITTLRQIQRESGRIIGLISHVPSLKEAASKELKVTQQIDGISSATFVD